MAGTRTDAIVLDDNTVTHSDSPSPSSAAPVRRSMLTSVMSNIEMDPCGQTSWVENVIQAAKQPGAPSLLELCKNTEKEQLGGFVDNPIGLNTYNTVVAPPQAGKTQAIMIAAMEVAYDSSTLTVMGVMNSKLETPRFRDTANKLNEITTRVAEQLDILPENTPRLRIFDEGSTRTYRTALTEWKKGSNVIPVFVVMMNSAKFNKFQMETLPAVVRTVERDEKGRPKIMLLTDEADLQFKTVSNTSQLERSIFGRKVTVAGENFESLQGVFTTVVSVTATPQAIATGEVDFGGRATMIYEPRPSSSNFQFHSKADWSNKLITRSTSEDVEEMYESMMADAGNRFALVYESANCKVAGRTAAARSTAERFVEKFPGKPGIVTFAWSSEKIEAYTADPSWIQFFRGAPGGLFAVKQENKGVFSFTGKKSVNSYPSIIDFMASRSAVSVKCKFILFAKELSSRAIPVKGTEHQWPLSDMWLEAPKMPQETRIQVRDRFF